MTPSLIGFSGWFEVRSWQFFTQKKMQASEALHHGLEPEKSRLIVVSAQIAKAKFFAPNQFLLFDFHCSDECLLISYKVCYFLISICCFLLFGANIASIIVQLTLLPKIRIPFHDPSLLAAGDLELHPPLSEFWEARHASCLFLSHALWIVWEPHALF